MNKRQLVRDIAFAINSNAPGYAKSATKMAKALVAFMSEFPEDMPSCEIVPIAHGTRNVTIKNFLAIPVAKRQTFGYAVFSTKKHSSVNKAMSSNGRLFFAPSWATHINYKPS